MSRFGIKDTRSEKQTKGDAMGTVRMRRRRRDYSPGNILFWIVFLGIPLLLYVVFVISPFVQAAYYSLTSWGGFSNDRPFVGLANYIQLFNDATFLIALRNSVILLVFLPAATLAVSLFFAVLISVGGVSTGGVRGLPGSGFYRVVSFFPHVIPGIVVGVMWAMVLLPRGGLVNSVLTGIGLSGFNSFPWLGTQTTALPVSILIMMWGQIGFYMLLFIAAIKDIPAETFEAARLDGAGRARTTLAITIPGMRDNVQTAWIWLGIFALDAFVYMTALNAEGGPNNSTLVITQYLFRVAFVNGEFGYASAMGVFLAVITLLFAAIVFSVNRIAARGKLDA